RGAARQARSPARRGGRRYPQSHAGVRHRDGRLAKARAERTRCIARAVAGVLEPAGRRHQCREAQGAHSDPLQAGRHAGQPAAAGMIRPAGAVLRLEVTEGNVQPVPIAIPDFLGGSPADSELARSISQVITADLRRSGLFAPIDPAAYIEKIVNADAVPRFADWRVINAQALVTGRLTRQTDGRLKSEFRLSDVFSGQRLVG